MLSVIVQCKAIRLIDIFLKVNIGEAEVVSKTLLGSPPKYSILTKNEKIYTEN